MHIYGSAAHGAVHHATAVHGVSYSRTFLYKADLDPADTTDLLRGGHALHEHHTQDPVRDPPGGDLRARSSPPV